MKARAKRLPKPATEAAERRFWESRDSTSYIDLDLVCAVRTTTETGIDVRRMKRAPTRPGEVLLEEFLSPLGMSQAEAARRMDMSTNRLNELVRGKRGVTADTALRLSRLLGTSAEFWLNLQMAFDLWHAHQAERRRGAA